MIIDLLECFAFFFCHKKLRECRNQEGPNNTSFCVLTRLLRRWVDHSYGKPHQRHLEKYFTGGGNKYLGIPRILIAIMRFCIRLLVMPEPSTNRGLIPEKWTVEKCSSAQVKGAEGNEEKSVQ